MAAANGFLESDERESFERWVNSLAGDLRTRLNLHIEAARGGPAWMREGLAATDVSHLAHLPAVDMLEAIHAALGDFERGDYVDLTPEQLEHWVEAGDQPWPDESTA